MNEHGTITRSSGNVFADIGLPNPGEELIKAQLVSALGRVITDLRLPQTAVAERLGIDQPKISALLRGRFGGYSIERLLRFLAALDYDVEIVVKPKAPQQDTGCIAVRTAYHADAAPSQQSTGQATQRQSPPLR